jgi:outer membrane protein assembly factor BamA
VFAEQRAEVSYKIERGGIKTPLTLPIWEKIRISLAYEFTYTREFDVDSGIAYDPQKTSIGSLTIAVSRDGRDDHFNPRWGTLVHLSQTFARKWLGGKIAGPAFGETIEFDRSVLRGFAYVSPLGDLFTLAFGGEAAVINPKDNDAQLPIHLRFFRGGDASVRSFWYQQLGPKADDDPGKRPVGGEAYLQFNIEARIPLFRFTAMALFFEGGSLKRNSAWWLHFGDREISKLDRFRYAVGAGIRANTPIGPLRLDFGYKPWNLPGEDTWALHFSVGHTF